MIDPLLGMLISTVDEPKAAVYNEVTELSINIRRYRLERSWSARELARRLNTSPSTVARWEQPHATITLRRLEDLAALFGVTIKDLFTQRKGELMTAPTDKQQLIERILPIVTAEKSQDSDYNTGTFYRFTVAGKTIRSRLTPDQIDAIATAWLEDREKVKQKMAMCTDDRTFLEEHKFANVIEYDEKLKRPSRAMYHNRQWEAERDGLNVLAALGERLANEEQN